MYEVNLHHQVTPITAPVMLRLHTHTHTHDESAQRLSETLRVASVAMTQPSASGRKYKTGHVSRVETLDITRQSDICMSCCFVFLHRRAHTHTHTHFTASNSWRRRRPAHNHVWGRCAARSTATVLPWYLQVKFGNYKEPQTTVAAWRTATTSRLTFQWRERPLPTKGNPAVPVRHRHFNTTTASAWTLLNK